MKFAWGNNELLEEGDTLFVCENYAYLLRRAMSPATFVSAREFPRTKPGLKLLLILMQLHHEKNGFLAYALFSGQEI